MAARMRQNMETAMLLMTNKVCLKFSEPIQKSIRSVLFERLCTRQTGVFVSTNISRNLLFGGLNHG